MNEYHIRVFCSCGWSYRPSHDDPVFGPKVCPNCGEYRGIFPKWQDLEDLRWEVKTVREKYKKTKFWGIIPGYIYIGYEDKEGNIY